MVSGLVGAWDLARKNVKKAQQAQKRCYHWKAKDGFKKGERSLPSPSTSD